MSSPINLETASYSLCAADSFSASQQSEHQDPREAEDHAVVRTAQVTPSGTDTANTRTSIDDAIESGADTSTSNQTGTISNATETAHHIDYTSGGTSEDDKENKRLALHSEWRQRLADMSPDMPEDVDPASILHSVAKSCFRTYQTEGQITEIKQATEMNEVALSLLPEDRSQLRHDVLVSLGCCLCIISDWASDDQNLARAIVLLQEAMSFDPPSDISLEYLANAHRMRYTRTADIADLNTAIRLHRDVAEVRGAGHNNRPATLTNLAAELLIRFKRVGAQTDLDEAIQLQYEALALRDSKSSPGHIISLHNLADALNDRFTHRGDLADVDEAISLRRRALEMCEEGHINYPVFLVEVADSLCTIFEQRGNLQDLEDALALYQRALKLAADHPNHRNFSVKEGRAYLKRYQQLGSDVDLDKAIDIFSKSVSNDSADKTVVLNELTNALVQRFERRGARDDLDTATELARKGLELRRTDDTGLHVPLNSMAYILLAKFKHYGSMSDLEDSVQLHWQALNLVPEGHTLRFGAMNNLANVLLIRFTQLGDICDLDEAIKLHQKAVKLCLPGHFYRGTSLDNLANVLLDRFENAGKLDDLEEAIELRREALENCPPGHWHRDACLHNLGVTLLTRSDLFTSLGESDILQEYGEAFLEESVRNSEEAMAMLHSALDIRVPVHPDRHYTLVALSRAYEQRFDRLGDEEDADAALDLMTEALEQLTPGHAGRSKCLFRMSRLHALGSHRDLATTVKLFVKAITDPCCNPQLRLKNAIHTLEAAEHMASGTDTSHALLLQAYVAVIHLLPAVAYFGLDIGTRLKALQEGEQLTLNGAAHALAIVKPEVALEMLDEGRGLFWTQALRLRTQFDRMPPGLSEKLVHIARQLEAESFESRGGSNDTSSAPVHQKVALRRRLSEEFEILVDQVRLISGFKDFMQQRKFESLARVSDKGPVVVLLACASSCEAIVIANPGIAKRVPLPLVSVKRLKYWSEMLRSSNRYQRSTVERSEDDAVERALVKMALTYTQGTGTVLEEMWTDLVRVVIDALELKTSTGRSRPRLWWCPTGQFTFLPVHAAGSSRARGDSCSDFVVSSYTPTLSALLTARQASSPILRKSTKVLLAAVPRPYRGSRLPFTVEEIESVRPVIPATALLSAPVGHEMSADFSSGASVQDILDTLPKATILHLASHGYQNPKNPLDSGFLMSDDILSVSKLMPLPLPDAFLAFLSACETAKGDEKQPDQTIHLAATMLFAGFKSVVGTMWSMNDVDGPVVAKAIYQRLFEGDSEFLDPESIPYALDDAVRSLRARGLHPSRWAPYIHLGV